MNFVAIKQKLSLISITVPNLKLISFSVSKIQAFLVKYGQVCKILTKQVIKTKMVSIDFLYEAQTNTSLLGKVNKFSGDLWILLSMQFFKSTALKYYHYIKYYHYYLKTKEK